MGEWDGFVSLFFSSRIGGAEGVIRLDLRPLIDLLFSSCSLRQGVGIAMGSHLRRLLYMKWLSRWGLGWGLET